MLDGPALSDHDAHDHVADIRKYEMLRRGEILPKERADSEKDAPGHLQKIRNLILIEEEQSREEENNNVMVMTPLNRIKALGCSR